MIAAAKPHPNQVAQQLTGRDYISYSAINTFRQCPLKYYFKYVAGLPEPIVPASLVFGGAIHAAIEHHFREMLSGAPAPTLDALVAAFRQAWADRSVVQVKCGKHESASVLHELAVRMLAAFQASETAQISGSVIGIEEELRGSIAADCPDLLARVDLLVEEAAGVRVIDFKTARSAWSASQADDAAEQLLLYSELVKPLSPGKLVQLEFVVITKAKLPSVERHQIALDRHRVNRIQRIAAKVWHVIQYGVFYPSPSAMNCPSCPFRQPCRRWGNGTARERD